MGLIEEYQTVKENVLDTLVREIYSITQRTLDPNELSKVVGIINRTYCLRNIGIKDNAPIFWATVYNLHIAKERAGGVYNYVWWSLNKPQRLIYEQTLKNKRNSQIRLHY